MTLTQIVRACDAAKSSIYGFVNGLLANGWLYEEDHRYFLGPAIYALTLASGHIRAGLVTHADLLELHNATGLTVFLGVQAGDHLIYLDEAGSDTIDNFEARSDIRRPLLATAGGKALLASRPRNEIEAFLKRRTPQDASSVDAFLTEYDEIRRTGIATNVRRRGSQLAIAQVIDSKSRGALAAITLVGSRQIAEPKLAEISALLSQHIQSWVDRRAPTREAI
jgi:DNA-binding IclR family transcriptional regulator